MFRVPLFRGFAVVGNRSVSFLAKQHCMFSTSTSIGGGGTKPAGAATGSSDPSDRRRRRSNSKQAEFHNFWKNKSSLLQQQQPHISNNNSNNKNNNNNINKRVSKLPSYLYDHTTWEMDDEISRLMTLQTQQQTQQQHQVYHDGTGGTTASSSSQNNESKNHILFLTNENDETKDFAASETTTTTTSGSSAAFTIAPVNIHPLSQKVLVELQTYWHDWIVRHELDRTLKIDDGGDGTFTLDFPNGRARIWTVHQPSSSVKGKGYHSLCYASNVTGVRQSFVLLDGFGQQQKEGVNGEAADKLMRKAIATIIQNAEEEFLQLQQVLPPPERS